VPEPAEAAFHSAAFEHNKAFMGGIALDHAAAHVLEIAPRLAALGDKGAVQHRFAQACPGLLARCQCLQAVAVLNVGTDDRHGEPGALGVYQGHALAPRHLFGGIPAARAAYRDACEDWVSIWTGYRYELGIDNGQVWLGLAAHGPAPQPCDLAQQDIEQAQLQPAPQPAASGAPMHKPGMHKPGMHKPGMQRPPGPAHPQVPRQRAHTAP
jgi:hypothetical protein